MILLALGLFLGGAVLTRYDGSLVEVASALMMFLGVIFFVGWIFGNV